MKFCVQMGYAIESCPLVRPNGLRMDWIVGSLLATCPDGLVRNLHFQCVFGQPTNVSEQASIEIVGSKF
jgi:hypothetical protein